MLPLAVLRQHRGQPEPLYAQAATNGPREGTPCEPLTPTAVCVERRAKGTRQRVAEVARG